MTRFIWSSVCAGESERIAGSGGGQKQPLDELAVHINLDVSSVSCSFHHLVTKQSQRFPTIVVKFRGHSLEYAQHRNVVRLS